MQVAEILNEIAKATGWKQTALGKKIGVSQATISKWLAGSQSPNTAQWDNVNALIGRDPRLVHLRHAANLGGSVTIVGRVGHGAAIEPPVSPKGASGLYEVSVPFPVPDGLVGLVVDGDSMLPKYEDGDVIIVSREQQREPIEYAGQLVAVQTKGGKQYLRKIFAGSGPGLFRLESFNAASIHDAPVSWIGQFRSMVPSHQVIEIEPRQPKTRRKSPAGQRAAK